MSIWIIAIWKLSYDLDENWYNMDSYIVSFYIFDFCIDNIMCELTIAIVKHWSLFLCSIKLLLFNGSAIPTRNINKNIKFC